MKRDKIIFWIATGLFCIMMILFGTVNFYKDMAAAGKAFEGLGYPASVPQWLGIAKVLGVLAITVRKFSLLKNLAYAGFLIDVVLALFAHLHKGDGEWMGAAMALILLAISWFMNLRMERAATA